MIVSCPASQKEAAARARTLAVGAAVEAEGVVAMDSLIAKEVYLEARNRSKTMRSRRKIVMTPQKMTSQRMRTMVVATTKMAAMIRVVRMRTKRRIRRKRKRRSQLRIITVGAVGRD